MAKFDLSEVAKEDAIVKSMVTDLAGGLKEIIFPSRVIKELVEVGIAYDGSSFRGINNINSSDAILQGVEETLVRIPESISDIHKPEYWIICNILSTDRTSHPNCARSKLVALQDQLASTWDGGRLFMGSEPEAYFVEHPDGVGKSDGGNSNYFNPKDPKAFIITEIKSVLDSMGFNIERAHTEVGDDQFEVNWTFDRAERTADRIQMYKIIAHKIARNYDVDVTFLPKPYPTRNGSGMHCHVSVGTGVKNLFYGGVDAASKKYFSDKSLQFITGILKNSRGLAAISNSTEVSYSRLVPGYEAPCVIAVGDCNRSAACRIPAIADPAMIEKAIRAEIRYPDPLANPYLLAAGFIACGIDGITSDVPFVGFTEEDLYAYSIPELGEKGFNLLPRNLWEAYQEFVSSDVLKKGLGGGMHGAYADLILEEVDHCQSFANSESIRMHYLD